MYRLEGLPYNESADIYAFGMCMLEIINNNCYPFGKGSSWNSKPNSRGKLSTQGGGFSSSNPFEDDNDGGILSPLDLLAELEDLSVDRLLDGYILPNINQQSPKHGDICITHSYESSYQE